MTTFKIVFTFDVFFSGFERIQDWDTNIRGQLQGNNEPGWFMVFNATFNNISAISWWSVLLMEETRVPGENL